ncbi:MAG: redoxin domain-containing protein [Chitinophagaceae bacterium]|nr:redoxin domain-containing protein [Chitinophagaceae bacterium]
MKYVLTLLVFISSLTSIQAKDGYKIKVKFTDVKDSFVYLCHYYGKAQTVYKDDSAHLSSKGEVTFQSNKKIEGGIYMILFADQSLKVELMLNNGDDFGITMAKSDVFNTAKFTGKSENEEFYKYQNFLVGYGKEYVELESNLAKAKTKADSTKIYDLLKAKGKTLSNYRKDVAAKSKSTLLSTIFMAVEEPEIPEELPTLPNGDKDSSYPRNFFKSNYWKTFNFYDNRLIFTPIYENKLAFYMEKLTVPTPDSVIKECKYMLDKTAGASEQFKFTLHYLSRWAEGSKIMGMDEVFVWLIDKYISKGRAEWVDSASMIKYVDRMNKILPNIIGKAAIDLNMQDLNGKTIPLSSVDADYTILIFYSPTCGTCKKELPLFDSLYKAALKPYNVKIYAVDSDADAENTKKLITDKNLNEGFIFVSDPQHITNFRNYYDVYANPTLYLLDKNKKIVGKKIDHTNVLGLIEYLEKKKTKK